jgi:hypothetical protein
MVILISFSLLKLEPIVKPTANGLYIPFGFSFGLIFIYDLISTSISHLFCFFKFSNEGP